MSARRHPPAASDDTEKAVNRTPRPRRARWAIRLVSAAVPIVAGLPVLLVPAAIPSAGAASIAVAGDAGTPTSTLTPAANAFPTGTGAQRAVSRDCGFSVPLPNGQSLWVFCDTAIFDNVSGTAPALDAQLRFVHSGTAALALPTTGPTPTAPLALHEASYPSLPTRWVTPVQTYGPIDDRRPITCATSTMAFAWTKGLTRLPGTNTVVGFVQEHCPEKDAGFPEYDISIVEWDAPAVAVDDLSAAGALSTSRRYDSVFVNPTPGSGGKWGYGAGPVVHGDHLYTYSAQPAIFDCPDGVTCTLVRAGSLTVARARWADGSYRSASGWEYWAGGDATNWSAEPAEAAEVLPDNAWPSGDGVSVAWHPGLGLYVMVHANSRFSPTDGLSVRVASTPWGPWSAPVDVGLDASSSYADPAAGCEAPTSCRTFIVHPELSGDSGNLYVSYVRNEDHATLDGQHVTMAGAPTVRVRLAAIPFGVLPLPAPETLITAGPVAATTADTATVSFEHVTRPTAPGEPAPPPAAAVTFSCALDGAGAPCASPFVVDGLADGAHRLVVTAVANGVADPTPAAWEWVVDRAAPDTTIESGPTPTATPGESTFVLAGSDDQTPGAALRFECTLAGGPWAPCDSPWTASTATTGDQEAFVRAVDAAGNVDPSPASWSWYVDMPPVVTITSGPAAFTRSTSATVNFTRSDDLTWTMFLDPSCSIDGAPFTACSSPVSLTGLAAGAHRVEVRVTDSAGATTTATHAWDVDLTPPSAPTVAIGARSNQDRPTIDLDATDDHSAPADLSYECSLDYAAWAPCADPATFGPLADGYHLLVVRARDQAGNLSANTSTSWTQDTVAPVATAGSGPAGTTTETSATTTFSGLDDRTKPSTLLTWSCSLDSAAATTCSSPFEVTALLPGAHRVAVQAIDEAGNRSAPLTWDWTVEYAVDTGLAPLTAGVAYQHRLTTNATGAAGVTERWSVTAGTLPPGIRLWAGELLGTPTAAGSFGPVTLQVTSELGAAQSSLTISVSEVDAIRGRVTNAVTGVGVPGIRVRLVHSSGVVVRTVDTGADGAWGSGYLAAGGYRFAVADPLGDHVSTNNGGVADLASAPRLDVVAGATLVEDVAVTPLTTIAGRVTDQSGGAPLAGAWVTLFDQSGTSVGLRTTDADGRYSFRKLPAGAYRVSFADMTGQHAREYWTDAADLTAATPIWVAAGGLVTADAALAPVTAVQGVVTDDLTGSPVSGVWVNLYDDRGTRVSYRVTDADGAYAFRFLAPGNYRVSFVTTSGAYLPASSSVSVEGEVVQDASLVPATTLTGVATAEGSGAALADVWVDVYDSAGAKVASRATGASGVWTVKNLVPGQYRVAFTDLTNRHVREHWNDAASLATATPLTAAGGTVRADVALAPVAVITGRVTSSITGAAVVGVRVSVTTVDGLGVALTTTGADGRYRFPALSGGAYLVSVGDPTGVWAGTWYPAASSAAGAEALTVAPGSTRVADLSVDPLSTVTGTVTDAATGSPVGGAWVTLTTADGSAVVVVATGADGRYRIVNVRPGDYRVRFSDPASRYRTQWWTAAATLTDATPLALQGGNAVANASLVPR